MKCKDCKKCEECKDDSLEQCEECKHCEKLPDYYKQCYKIYEDCNCCCEYKKVNMTHSFLDVYKVKKDRNITVILFINIS